jgi:hypothetical protein
VRCPLCDARYAQARRELAEHSIAAHEAGTRGEAPGALNDAVIEARRGVPRWRRMLIDRRVLRELDYWNRTGEGRGASQPSTTERPAPELVGRAALHVYRGAARLRQ